jgi:chromosome segregation ATPase
MFIDKRSLMIGVCVGMILMGVVGLVNAISYRDRLVELENEVIQREATIHELESLNALHEEELMIKDSDIKELEDNLHISEENCSQLTARLNDLEMNNSALASEIQLLERAVLMVGREDIEELLWAYTEVSMQYKDLQREYDELISQYYKLLSQVP